MEDVEVTIIGGGAVGMACAAAISPHHSVLLLERHEGPGRETSSRNSGVIHAGLYYPPGSLKAELCVVGRRLLYERCKRYDIGHRKSGKLVVATAPDEVEKLETLSATAQANDAGEVRLIDSRQLAQLEPQVRAVAALLSPETGIVDAHELIYSYQKEATDSGALLAFRTELKGLDRDGDHWRLETMTQGDAQPSVLSSRVVINAAGLDASCVAQLAGLDTAALGYTYHYCKGDYFALASELEGLVSHLVYPLPSKAGLGIHITFDLGGQLRLGPDTEYVDSIDYEVLDQKRHLFAEAARRYLPMIEDRHLRPDYAGIRPKLQGPGEAVRDFVIEDATCHGLPGLINLLGIESPGLTASEAIAARVLGHIRAYF